MDLIGETYGLLTVMARDANRPRGDGVHSFWICRCTCGSVKSIRQTGLRSGRTKSCGCYQRVAHVTHGMSRTPEFKAWTQMLGRCSSPTHKQYADYGGRGISVCPEWQNSFEAFYVDMGGRPSSKHSLDRRNNAIGYSKSNCRWATGLEQQRNRRSNRLLTYEGRTMTVVEWAEFLGLPKSTLEKRLSNGWSPERALSTPKGRYRD